MCILPQRKKKISTRSYTRGFTMFFAVLVASLALSIGLAIYDLVIRELQLSTTTTQSQYAIYAADTAAECALYWDFKYNTSFSIFPTSTTDVANGVTSGAPCDGVDIAVARTSVTTATSGFSTTTLTFSTTSAIVAVTKIKDAGGIIRTTIYAHGYSTKSTVTPYTVERELKIVY